MAVATAVLQDRDIELPDEAQASEEPRPRPVADGGAEPDSRPWGEFPPGWDDFQAALRRYRESLRR
jgi:hypothetical protein